MKDRLFFILTICALLPFVIFVGGRVPYFLLYTFLLASTFPLIHNLLASRFIEGKINIPDGEFYAGQEINIQYKIENKGMLSLTRIELYNKIAHRITGQQEEREVFTLAGEQIHRGSKKIICKRRGIYEIGEIHLKIKDPFDLFTISKKIQQPIKIKVYPSFQSLKNFKIKATQIIGDILVKDPILQDYGRTSDLRQYQEGDSIKKIYWKASAKKQDIFVRNFEQRGSTEVTILLDSHKSTYPRGKKEETEDFAVEVSLSIIAYCLQEGIQTSVLYENKGQILKTQGNGSEYLKQFMNNLVSFHGEGRTNFVENIQKILPLPNGTNLILITHHLNRELAIKTIELKLKNTNIACVLLGEQDNQIIQKLQIEKIPVYTISGMENIEKILEDAHEVGA